MLTLLPWYAILQRATSCFGKSLKTSIVGLVKAKSRLLEDCAENYNFVKLRGRWDTMQLFLLLSGYFVLFVQKIRQQDHGFIFSVTLGPHPCPGINNLPGSWCHLHRNCERDEVGSNLSELEWVGPPEAHIHERRRPQLLQEPDQKKWSGGLVLHHHQVDKMGEV